jgi:molybdopterin biosynthesis enzyme MoaB
MKEIKTIGAVGLVICHDITRIIPGKDGIKEIAFRKGHTVRDEDIPALLKLGKEHLFVWSDEPGMIHENAAAGILLRLSAGNHIRGSEVREGKIDLIAEKDGLLRVNKVMLSALNAFDDFILATRHDYAPVRKDDVIAGTRAIPLAVSGEQTRAVEAAVNASAGGKLQGEKILNIMPFKKQRAGIVTTGNEVYGGLVKDDFAPKVREKMGEYGIAEAGCIMTPDDPETTTKAILDMINVKDADMVFVTGGMSVDPDDRTPLAIRSTGAEVAFYGTPVLPGSMFMLAYYRKEHSSQKSSSGHIGRIPILGLPGCVMHDERTVFDIILPRLTAGLTVTRQDINELAKGGLCLRCKTCIFPNCGFGAV